MKQPKVGEYWYAEHVKTLDGVPISRKYEIDKFRVLAIYPDHNSVILSTVCGPKGCHHDRLICKVEFNWFWKLLGYK